jgi:hypothetical protein
MSTSSSASGGASPSSSSTSTMKKSIRSLGDEASEEQQTRTRVMLLPFAITISGLAAGIFLWIFSDDNQYVCGAKPPSQYELKLYPSCVMIESSSSSSSTTKQQHPMPAQPLCLQAGAEQDSAPTWCYNSIFDRTSPMSYYLYWLSSSSSNDADDESSWRLFEEPSTEESWYKYPLDAAVLSELPQSGDEWLAWREGEWETTDISISICSESDDETTIPDVCYESYPRMDKDNPNSGMVKAAIPIMFFFGIAFVYCCLGTIFCFDDGSSRRTKSSDHYTHDDGRGLKRERTATDSLESVTSVSDGPPHHTRAMALDFISEHAR